MLNDSEKYRPTHKGEDKEGGEASIVLEKTCATVVVEKD